MKPFKRKTCLVVALFVLGVFSLPVAATPTVVDLTTPGSEGTINDAIFRQYTPQPTGTGVFDPFLRIQLGASGSEEGYNTDGSPLWKETKSGKWTHSLLLGDVGVTNIGGVGYREFRLDIDESGNKKEATLSLDVLKIYLEATPNITGDPAASLTNQVYNLDGPENNWIKLSYGLNGSQPGGGSGQGDMLAFIPDSLFTGSNRYVYFYSVFGATAEWECNDGPEEWAHLEGTPLIPAPGAILLGGIGVAFVGWLRKRRTL